jgi:hypothetical protein
MWFKFPTSILNPAPSLSCTNLILDLSFRCVYKIPKSESAFVMPALVPVSLRCGAREVFTSFGNVTRCKLVLVRRPTDQQTIHLPTHTSQNDRRMESPQYPVFSILSPKSHLIRAHYNFQFFIVLTSMPIKFFAAFARSQKATISFAISVRQHETRIPPDFH